MKAIHTDANITSISSRRDGSLRFSTETPELSDEQKVAFMNLQGKNLKMLIEEEEGSDEVLEVETPLEGRTPSQRLRGKVFRWWDAEGRPETFDIFYSKKMESIINGVEQKYL